MVVFVLFSFCGFVFFGMCGWVYVRIHNYPSSDIEKPQKSTVLE